MTAGLPCLGMHKNSRIDAEDIGLQLGHGFPPVLTNVVSQLYTILTIIVHGGQSIVNFAGRKNKAILFAVGNDFFEKILVVHGRYKDRQREKLPPMRKG